MSRTQISYDKRNNFICVGNAYSIKEMLKSLGFRWNPMGKEWLHVVPSGVELGNLLCDIFVASADMDIYDLSADLESLPGAFDAIALIDVNRQQKFAAKADQIKAIHIM